MYENFQIKPLKTISKFYYGQSCESRCRRIDVVELLSQTFRFSLDKNDGDIKYKNVNEFYV